MVIIFIHSHLIGIIIFYRIMLNPLALAPPILIREEMKQKTTIRFISIGIIFQNTCTVINSVCINSNSSLQACILDTSIEILHEY